MSKRSHRRKVKGKPYSGSKINAFSHTKQYVNNPRRKYEFEKGEVL